MSSSPRIAVVTQARTRSTRLPGKILLTAAGRSLLDWHLARLRRARLPEVVAVATTVESADDPLAAYVLSLGVPVTRGPEDDVLERFRAAAEALEADVVVRVTSDCPLLDPAIVDGVIARLLDTSDPADYVSTSLDRRLPLGMSAEAITRDALERAALEATLPEDREHVTPYLYRTRPELFRLRHWTLPGIAAPDERWTVDTPEDFELVRALLEHFGPAAETVTTAELLAFIQTRPDLRALNRHVVQKTLAALPNR